MLEIALIVSLPIVFFVGYKLSKIEAQIKGLSTTIEKKKDVEPMKSNDTNIIDPLDPIQRAIYEHKEMMKQLNPDEDYDE